MRGNEAGRTGPHEAQQDCPQTCPVCTKGFLSEGTKSRPWSLRRCGHTFCYACIEKFFETRRVCPICNVLHSVAWKYDIERNRREIGGIVLNYAAEALVEWKNKQDSSQKAMKDAKVCWDCNLVYETNSIESFFQTHAEHRVTSLSNLPEDVVKQLLWILKQLKEDNWSFSRTEVMLQAYLTFTENHLKHLKTVQSIMRTRNPAEVKNITDDLKFLCEEGPKSTKFKNKDLLDSFQEIWTFEVRDAKRHMQNLIHAKVIPSSINSKELLADLEKDTSPIIPTGISDKYVQLMPALDRKWLSDEKYLLEQSESHSDIQSPETFGLEDAPFKILIPTDTRQGSDDDNQDRYPSESPAPARRIQTRNTGRASLTKKVEKPKTQKKASSSSARKRAPTGTIRITDTPVSAKGPPAVKSITARQADHPKSPIPDFLDLEDSDYVIDTDMESMLASNGTRAVSSNRNTASRPSVRLVNPVHTRRSTSNSRHHSRTKGEPPTVTLPNSTPASQRPNHLISTFRSASTSNHLNTSNNSQGRNRPIAVTSVNADNRQEQQSEDEELFGLGKRPEYRLEVVEDDADFDMDGVEFLQFSRAIDAADHRLDEAIHAIVAQRTLPN